MATEIEVTRIIAGMALRFPNWHPTKETYQAYYEDLHDLEADLLAEAVKTCYLQPDRAFAPSVGEIRGAARDLLLIQKGVKSSAEAWEEVLYNLTYNGGDFGNPEWSTHLIEKCVKTMGWRNLRFSENVQSDRIRFMQTYDALLGRASEEMMRPESTTIFLQGLAARMALGSGRQLKD